MTFLNPLRKLYYKLILEKAFHIELEEFFLYFELQNEGADLHLQSSIPALHFQGSVRDKILDTLPLDEGQNCFWDSNRSELVFTWNLDFTHMGPSQFVKRLESFQKKIFQSLVLIEKFHVEHQFLR